MLVRGLWPTLRSVTTRSLGSQKAAWFWLVKTPGVKWPAIGVAPVAAGNFSTARWPVFLDNITLTSAEFSMAAMAQLPAEASPRFSSDVWYRCHRFSFCRCAVPLGSQGWCHPSGRLLQGIHGHHPPSFAGHQGLLTLWKFPFELQGNQEQRHMGPSLGSMESPFRF